MTTTQEWIEKQRHYLELEREAERLQLMEKLTTLTSQECQEIGISLLLLDIESSCVSLYGRVKHKIIRKDQQPLPIHSFKVGDEAELFEYKKATSKEETVAITGIISKVTSMYIELISDESDGVELVPPLRLNMRSSEATHTKLVHALNDLGVLENTPAWPVVDLLFSDTPLKECIQRPIIAFNPKLNESQINAVSYALCAPNLALIHGPPGTGKTTAVIELILQSLACGFKLLVCAPSNVAVDNILERLVTTSTTQSETFVEVTPSVVRLGHPARVSESIQSHCLDALIASNEGTEIVDDVRKEIDTNLKALAKAKSKKDRTLQRELQTEIRSLRKEIRKREERVVQRIMESRNVVLSTLVGASSRQLRGTQFDMVIIDEAAQALEVACWIPMLRTSKVVLAGDHCQLPPTIKSVEAERLGLGVTLFERIITVDRLSSCAQLLDIQYRMNKQISDWSSHEMYHDRLRSHESNSSHTLVDLISKDTVNSSNSETKGLNEENEDLTLLSKTVMLLIDTAGCNMEENSCRGGSYRNTAEAEIVVAHIYRLYELGLKPEQIGVITPYNGQLELLRELVAAREGFGEMELKESSMSAKERVEKSRLEIRTVDGFQGGEKEAIILSLVRSNENREVGFLAERRRINVAVTRAKRHLVLVCDSDTCSNDSFISRLLSHVSTQGEHRSALEYLQSIGVTLSSHTTVTEEHSSTSLPLPSSSSQSFPSNSTTANNQPTLTNLKKLGATENKLISKQMKKLEAQHNHEKSNQAIPHDSFYQHVEHLLLHFAHGSLQGGVIGNGAIRILEMQNHSFETLDEELKYYSNLITPQKNQNNQILLFPSVLNSHQRLIIHTISESINSQHNDELETPRATLFHESIGEGENRKIEIHAKFTSLIDVERTSDVVETSVENILPTIESSSNQFDLIVTEDGDHLESLSSSQPEISPSPQKEIVQKIANPKEKKSKKEVIIPPPRSQEREKKKVKEDKVLVGIKAGLTEDELLEEAIKANAEHANYHKYRLKSTPMPNPEKVKAAATLRATINESQLSRGGETRKSTMESNKQSSNGTNNKNKKVVKKPPTAVRNFGGGKLGGGGGGGGTSGRGGAGGAAGGIGP